MTFAFKCFVTNPPATPCDVEWSVDPVVGVAAALAGAIAALGLFALLYMISRRSA